mmetsp:Transcript_18536/g.29553  ORF Transcript_18536/g.29553 Transcript_18536/m.29553 type:complete len:105 (+) Transcript_18536:1532-1846(+)
MSDMSDSPRTGAGVRCTAVIGHSLNRLFGLEEILGLISRGWDERGSFDEGVDFLRLLSDAAETPNQLFRCHSGVTCSESKWNPSHSSPSLSPPQQKSQPYLSAS